MSGVEATGLGVEIGGARLLDGVDLRVEAGDWVSVIGPNGAGKSTLLRAIAGVASLDRGTLTIAGRAAGSLNRRDRARLISWVPQTPVIPSGITVFDYVLLGRTPHLRPLAREGAADLAIAERVLGELDLADLAERHVETLSGGELQRAVIGRALAQEAPILLLDEPTAALDLGHQQELLNLLDDLRQGDRRAIITTMHDLTLAGVYADRLTMLAEGKVVAAGLAADVLTDANLARYYGAEVTITDVGGRVIISPRL